MEDATDHPLDPVVVGYDLRQRDQARDIVAKPPIAKPLRPARIPCARLTVKSQAHKMTNPAH
jgi:hypothetical protein